MTYFELTCVGQYVCERCWLSCPSGRLLSSIVSCHTAGKSKGKKKSKKKAADLDSVFAALDQNGASENGDADTGTARSDAMTNRAQPDIEADEAAAFGTKKKKSSRQKGDWIVPKLAGCRSLLPGDYLSPLFC